MATMDEAPISTTGERTKVEREVRRDDETTISYSISGPADGPTFVLVHGWGCNRRDFDGLTDWLPADYRVVAVDLAEHGLSSSTRGSWSMAEFAADVAAVIEAESIESCVAVGHSMGGAVVVELARLLPQVVSRIVTFDSLHYLFLFPALDPQSVEQALAPLQEDFAGLVRAMVEAGSPAGTDEALKDAHYRKMVVVRQPAGAGAFEGIIRWDMDEALQQVQQPITVFGVRDLVSQEALDRYGDRFEFVLVELGTHHFPFEAPRETAELLKQVPVA